MQHPAQIAGELLDMEERKAQLSGKTDQKNHDQEAFCLHHRQAELALNLASCILEDVQNRTNAGSDITQQVVPHKSASGIPVEWSHIFLRA